MIKLKFQRQHNSISTFEPVELPDFTVLTGVNGAGKSHLLEAIRDGHVAVEGIDTPIRIVYFNYESFRLDNESAFTSQQLESERQNAWNWYEKNAKPQAQGWRNRLGGKYIELKALASSSQVPLWSVDETMTKEYRRHVETFFQNDKNKNNQQAQGVFALIKSLPVAIDEIDRETFDRHYKPYTFKNDFLPAQLGKVFWDYYVRYDRNQYSQFLNERNGEEREVLSDTEFVEANGPRPWVIINQILSEFDTLNYEVTNPEGYDVFQKFQLRLKHTKKRGLEIEFDKLSSGERVLMALVASIYKSGFDRHFPGLLLLDEVDASLHPSMMRNMLKAIENVFLSHGARVVLVTHSPTTIALSPDDSIHLMHPEGLHRVERVTKNIALEVLTQGFVTLDQGLRIVDEIVNSDVTIITEGNNTLIIEKAIQVFGVTGVTVVKGLEDKSGKNSLKTIFQFLSRVNHQGRVLVVWDCDVSPGVTAENNTYPYVLPQNNENKLVKRGIENAFPEIMFKEFVKVTRLASGEEIRQFDPDCKTAFTNHVIANATQDDFKNFKGLMQEIESIKGAG